MKLGRLVCSLAAVATVAAAPAMARAQAFGLNEIGSCAVSRTGTGVGAPCQDASAVYWNPAYPTQLPGLQVYAGVAAIALDGSFTEDFTRDFHESDAPVEYPPHLFVTYQMRPRLSLGVGAYVPYGLTSQWAQDFPGRFSAQKASLQTVYVQPNVAYEVVPGRLSIGGGPVIAHSSVELAQSLDLAQQRVPVTGNPTFGQFGIPPRTEFGRAALEGDDWGFGVHVGLHAQLTRTLSFGARYLSEVKFEYEGDVAFVPIATGLTLAPNNPFNAPAGTPVDALLASQFQQGGALVAQEVATAITHPQQLQVGFGYTGLPNTTIGLDLAWIGWSAFDELPVEFLGPAAANSRTLIEDYEDSFGVRGSVQYDLTGQFQGWQLRAGASYAGSAAPPETVTPLLPDADRYNFAAGVTIPLAERWAIDAGYWRVETRGRRGRIVERESRTQTAEELNSGWYELNANVLSVSLKARF